MRMRENRVHIRKRHEVREQWRRLHNEEHFDLRAKRNVILVMK